MPNRFLNNRTRIGARFNPTHVAVVGLELDAQTRCAHYHSRLDVVAVKMKCCGVYYACRDCHDALADHPIVVWPRAQFDESAVMCGACSTQMTITRYLSCSNRCSHCGCPFNPGCRDHYASYFDCDLETRSPEGFQCKK